MTLKLSDRVRENTTTVGSGVLSLVGNTDGFRRFDNVLASGDITYYCIEENDKFEIGIGTYQNNSISRDYILQSTQSGSKINLGGSGVVFLTYPADKAVYKNQESEVVVGPSGIRFFDNTVQKTATISSASQDLIYISGVANYSSGQAINNEFDIISVSGWAKNYVDSQEYSSTAVSGWADVTFLKQSSNPFTYISGIAVYASGNSNNGGIDIYTSGVASYASGQVILNSRDIVYLSGIAAYASGNVGNGGGIDLYTSGVATYGSGQSNKNTSDIVYLSGLIINAEETNEISYISGIAVYGSGQSIDNELNISKLGNELFFVSGISNYASGLSTINQTNIVYLSGLVVNAEETLDINYISGIAIYSSGNSLTNQSAIEDIVNDLTYISGLVVSAEESNDISYISGIAVYVSGNALYNLIEDTSPQLGGNLNTGMFNVSGVGNIISNTGLFTSLKVNNTDVSLNGHTHVANDITNFNTAVSGLIPVKNIFGGNNISVSSINGEYTISASGLVAGSSESIVTTVFNKTGNPIPKMTAVYLNGGQGDLPTIQKAIATSDPTSAATYGLTYEAISNMATGRVIIIGALTNLNTDQFNPTAPHGDVNGKILYLSPYISGALTTTKPYAPNHIVSIGTIVRTHQNQGIIEVRIQNGFELEELHNVAISGVHNGEFLQYNSSSGLWIASNSGYFSNLHLGPNGLRFNDGTNQTTSGLPYTSGNLIDKNTSNIHYVSGIANYASGQSINNQNDITSINTKLVYISGLAVLAEESLDIAYISGIANYGSGQAIQNQQQILATSGWAVSNFSTINDLNYVSGLAVSAEESIDINYISGIATYTSGKIYNDTYISGIAVYASGQSILNNSHINSVSGWADISFLRETSAPFIYLSGLTVASEETNDIIYISGIASYASGQSINNKQDIVSVSGWAKNYTDSQDHTGIATSGWASSTFATINSVNYISGVANYASGQSLLNQSNITILNSNLVYISGLAVLAEETLDINYISGIAVYGSGQSNNNLNQILAVSGWTNSTFLKDTSPPFIYLSGLVVAAEESNDISYVSGISVYSSGLSTQNKIDIIAVSGLISGSSVSIANPSDNRLLTSTGTSSGINAESNLTFDGSFLNINGSGLFASGLNISNQTASTIASFDSNKNLSSLSTTTYPTLTELSYVKGVTSAIQTQIDSKSSSTHVHGNITNAGAIGSTANLPLITTTAGAITVGSFGTAASTFCQGNDSRLSDSRVPTGAAGGDLTGTYPSPTLTNTTVVAGTYRSVTVDAKGRITGGTNPTTISGYGITDVGNGTLTLNVSGTGLSGSASFTANQSGNTTFTITSNATSANTASAIVARDASGNFSAGIITATLSGNSSTTSQTNFSNLTINSSQVLSASNYNSYALPLSGGTLTGPVQISTGATNGNFNEGLRLTTANNGWTGITFGSTGLAGAPTNGWFAARNPSNQFIISPADSNNTTGLTLNSGGDALWRNNILLHAGNYNSYAPTLTGGGASGTWGISILGTAASETLATVTGRGNTTGSIIQSNASVRAPIFYDSQDTGYYLDPNSNSNIVTLTAGNTVYSYNWFRSYGATGWFNETYLGGIWMQDSTYIRVYNNKIFYNDNSIQSANSMFAPIFYDWNNTNYYLDPNSSSRLNNIVIDAETCYGWIDLPNVTGLRSAGINAAHFHPNDGSYGSWRVKGTRGGWAGLEFDSSGAGNTSLMMSSARTGVHNNSYGWQWFWENGDFYISKSTYGGNATLVKVLTSATDANSKGSVKAFCSFNGQSASPTSIPRLIDHNISLVARVTTGEFQIFFLNQPPSANYVINAMGTRNANIKNVSFAKFQNYALVEFRNESGVLMNPIWCDISFYW